MLIEKYKVCSKCGENKPYSEYHKRPERSIGVKPSCIKCANAQRKHYYKVEKERGDIKRKVWERCGINITLEEYTEKYDAIGGKCEICNTKFDVLCVDHKHSDGTIRGLLCTQCNLGLANFKDSKVNMKNAMRYINKYGADHE